MALSAAVSIPTGLAVAGVVYAIHSNATPSVADVQALPSGNADIDAAEKRATWLSIAAVSGVALLAKDPTIFVIGAGAVIGMAVLYRHANWTESLTALVPFQGHRSPVSPADTAAGPQMTPSDAAATYSGATSEFVSS